MRLLLNIILMKYFHSITLNNPCPAFVATHLYGGKIETLIEAAEKTQLATWNRLSGKTKRDKAKAKAQKEAEKKRKATEAAEAAKNKRAGVTAKSSTSNASRLGL